MDHAGLPLKTVLEQLDLLGEEVIPVLRKELDRLRPAHVPEAPTHRSLLEQARRQNSNDVSVGRTEIAGVAGTNAGKHKDVRESAIVGNRS
jgi:hypothetical protein